VYITDDTYTKQQVLRMEKLLLKVLSFDLCAPSTLSFINLYAAMMNIPEKVQHLAKVREEIFDFEWKF
jgi:cyclin-A